MIYFSGEVFNLIIIFLLKIFANIIATIFDWNEKIIVFFLKLKRSNSSVANAVLKNLALKILLNFELKV